MAPIVANPETYLAGICAEMTKPWPTNRTINIVCHGHSVPAGYFKTPAVHTFEAYPYLLHRGLAARFPYAVINVIVTGIGGENAEQGAQRFDRDVLGKEPDVVTIDYALNDRGIGLPRAEKAWRIMIEMALAHHVKVILLTPTPDMSAHLDDPNDPLNQHARQIRRLAAEYHVGLVDSLELFEARIKAGIPLKDLMAQGNHPNAQGHQIVAAGLLQWFPTPESRHDKAAGTAASVPPQIKGALFQRGKSGTISITIDGTSGGLRFDGVGAVSAGASTRLLIDYPEVERSQILDYLFKPNYGAALQILKVEIGADTDTTCGSEPSHEAVRGKVNGGLGYEWWLMKEAKTRNPAIRFEGLAWGAPGWVGKFWSDNNIAYTISWLDCARQNGFSIAYLGGGNERGYNADYYIKLRKALNEHGYSNVKLIASEDHHPPNYWAVATDMKANPAFAAAVDILGEHDVCGWRTPQYHCHVSADALSLGKPLWDSENSTQNYLLGDKPLARVMTRHYLDGGVTGNMNWAPVASMYSDFPCAGTGLILADTPWSGYYALGKSIWVDAHTTQFAQPGWRYLDGACGYTSGGGSFVTLRQPDGKNYTMVIETVDLTGPETLAINVTGGLSAEPAQWWSTDLLSTKPADDFVHVATIKPGNGHYSVTIQPGHVYTLSTTTGQAKGNARSSASYADLMPLPYAEDFESARGAWPAKYFCDVEGRFEIAPCGGGRAGHGYRQVITQQPILWHGATMPPTTVMGDPRWSGNYEVSADAMLEEPGYVELLGRIQSQQHTVAGYHLQIADSGAWKLYTENVAGKDRTLAAGANAPFGVNHWHRLGLHFAGQEIIASDDGKTLADLRDTRHTTGQIGLRVSPWQHAEFDNVRVVPVHFSRGMVDEIH